MDYIHYASPRNTFASYHAYKDSFSHLPFLPFATAPQYPPPDFMLRMWRCPNYDVVVSHLFMFGTSRDALRLTAVESLELACMGGWMMADGWV